MLPSEIVSERQNNIFSKQVTFFSEKNKFSLRSLMFSFYNVHRSRIKVNRKFRNLNFEGLEYIYIGKQ